MVRETGDAHALKVESDFPTPKLGAGQVLVKNEFAGINFIDTYHRSGLYARDLPFVGGQEGGGVVAAVSDEAEAQGIQVGDRVVTELSAGVDRLGPGEEIPSDCVAWTLNNEEQR